MTEVAEAEAEIFARMPAAGIERLAVEAAAGRVLAEPIRAERDQPPFDRVTMDGIALAHADWAAGRRRYARIAVQAAGAESEALTAPGQCVQIMTGAMLPRGADTVIPIERLTIDGDSVEVAEHAVAPQQFVHAQGSDRGRGELLLEPGAWLGPAEIAVLASAGAASVAVARLPRVAAVSTGDELVGPGEPLAPFQIRSTNDLAIAASLVSPRLADVRRARLRDDPEALLQGLERLHEDNDVLILSGGVSMGQFDFVPAVLETLGAELVFHKIEQKPGRPMWFGITRAGKPVFALPGNPVSTLVCTTRYVVPAFRRAAGLAPAPVERVKLTADQTGPERLTWFLPVRLHWSDAGEALAEPRPTNTSGDFVSLAGTDGFVELPKGRAVHRAGTVAPLFRW
jgi:molybdopterin molybdotransferase